MLRNKQQNKALHLLVGELNISSEMKEELVYQFTNGRETSSSKMLVNECQSLINHLNHIKNGTSATNRKVSNHSVSRMSREDKDKCQKMRRKILSIFHEMGWKKQGQLDWTRINEWLLTRGYLKKALNDYKLAELPKLVSQVEKLLLHHYNGKI